MLSEKDLAHFKEKLLKLKKDMTEVLTTNDGITFDDSDELTSYDNHFADTATNLDDREKQITLNDNAQNILNEVEEAFERIRQGTYGICVDSGEEIPYERLEALPYAKRTVEAQQKFEEQQSSRVDYDDKSFSTPKDDVRGDKLIDNADTLLSEHGNSSYR